MPSRSTPRCASCVRQALVEAAPARAGVLRAPHGRAALGHHAPVARVERDHVEAVAIVRMRGGGEAELGRQAVGDLVPRLPGVVAAVHADVVLLVQAVVVARRHHELVHAVADLGVLERPVGAQARGCAASTSRAVVGRLEDAEALDHGPEARGIVGVRQQAGQAEVAGRLVGRDVPGVAARAGRRACSAATTSARRRGSRTRRSPRRRRARGRAPRVRPETFESLSSLSSP